MGEAGPDALFEQLIAQHAGDPTVTLPTSSKDAKFGSSALKVNGKIFAMVMRGDLVVKLPKRRVDELVAGGMGRRFGPGRGRVMKEWIAVAVNDARVWHELAHEARQYVAAIGAGDKQC